MDLYAAKNKALVWRGVAQDTLNHNGDKNQKMVQKVSGENVQEMAEVRGRQNGIGDGHYVDFRVRHVFEVAADGFSAAKQRHLPARWVVTNQRNSGEPVKLLFLPVAG